MSDPHPTPGLLALAEAMKARMAYLSLTTIEVSARGGPSRTGMREIAEGNRIPRKATLDKIDKVLGWPAGTARAILNEERSAPAADEWLELVDQNQLGLVRSRIVTLRREHQRLGEYHHEQAEQLGSVVEILDTYIRANS
ncbi:MAG: hypothetical protein AB7G47_20010 [Mycolicibacterium sp.]|uniref:hypothetical protein n=1 Tax=Mycolicibacterium sp. TaxID=2320850 RepID=UPI003D11DE91